MKNYLKNLLLPAVQVEFFNQYYNGTEAGDRMTTDKKYVIKKKEEWK